MKNFDWNGSGLVWLRARCGRCLAACATVLLLWGPVQAQETPSAFDGAAHFARAVSRAYDNPRAALASEQAITNSGASAPEQRFWSLLAQARIQALLEQPPRAMQALQAAKALLSHWPEPGSAQQLAWRIQDLQVALLSADTVTLLPRMRALATQVQDLGHARLICQMHGLRSWLLAETSALDEAYRATEQHVACAQALGEVEVQANAVVILGDLVSRVPSGRLGPAGALTHFKRGEQVLGSRPARLMRSIIEWYSGKTLASEDPQQALAHLERARVLSESVQDEVGAGVSMSDAARVHLHIGDAQRALQLARAARDRFQRLGADLRMPPTFAIAVQALTRLNDPAVLAEIELARAWDSAAGSVGDRAEIPHANARAYAALGRHQQAYRELERYIELDATGRDEASSRAMQGLQAVHEAARRDAENAQLRLRDDAARAQLAAGAARLQTLWVTVAALALAMAAAVVLTLRTHRQRRAMAELALRDELTGAPNRRAVLAQAEALHLQCRRQGQVLGVALVDLDHFKRINDSYGHDVGDHTLRAFARVAMDTLRAQDRWGRFGGEEWLLVLPGSGPRDVQAVFTRLRDHLAAAAIEGLPQPHGVSFSMGAAFDDGAGASLQDLINAADRRLYRAKHGGRNRLVARDDSLPAPASTPLRPADLVPQ